MQRIMYLIVSLAFSIPLIQVQAKENMNFYGVLIEPPPCSINNGNLIDISFGDKVGVSKVDGNNYLQQISYQIVCEAGSAPWNMTLEIVGTSTDYDNAAIKTNMPDLGIRILQNGQAYEVNKPIKINALNPPKLEAVPVKRPGSMLKEGEFEATATLLAIYQ